MELCDMVVCERFHDRTAAAGLRFIGEYSKAVAVLELFNQYQV